MIDFDEEQYDASKLSFAVVENALINTDSGSEVYDGMRAPFFLNRQLVEALKINASDIHFESFAESVVLRFRVDGVMREVLELPKEFGRLVITRLKVIAGLDISEQNLSQSGRFKMSFGTGEQAGVDFRCSVIPTIYGETLNLRVLYLPEAFMNLEMLGFDQSLVAPVLYHANRTQGLILITGPTGGGKTVTLYTLLKHINTRTRSIFTIEDPVEIELPGINQISITSENSFGSIARGLLRQDPDVIMIGEMRDRESCEVAVHASNTGHLVLATLHANSASKSITRLTGLGLSREDIATVLSLVINQRLLRRLDPKTRVKTTEKKERLLAIGFREDEIEDLQLYKARPDEKSNGYKGRIGIYQVVSISPEISHLIVDGATDCEIDNHLRENRVSDLRRNALNKLKEGITDLDEVERVFGYVNYGYGETCYYY